MESRKVESRKALPKNGAYSNSIYYKHHFRVVLSCFLLSCFPKAGKHCPKMVLNIYTITLSTIFGQCFPAFRFHAFHFQAFKLPTLLHYLILTFEQTNQIIVLLYYKHHFWAVLSCFPLSSFPKAGKHCPKMVLII